MKTKTTTRKPRAKKTPDLMTVMQKGTGMKAKVPKTAAQIADECETEAKKLLSLADILRGKG